MRESTDMDRLHWMVESLFGEAGGILKGISSIFSKSAAPAEFCLCNLGVFWNKFNFISFQFVKCRFGEKLEEEISCYLFRKQ